MWFYGYDKKEAEYRSFGPTFTRKFRPVIRTPDFIRRMSTSVAWGDYDQPERVVYLTFDDGPIPEVTPWVLDQLKAYKAKATFFCLGKNVAANPDLFARIIEEGHAVGNHTFDHTDGWKSGNLSYYKSVIHCADLVKSNLFRPPYGRITPRQIRALKQRYKIILWSILSQDIDSSKSPEQCVQNVSSRVRNGDIIVFHDSLKAWPNLNAALPATLDYLKKAGFRFLPL